MPERDGEDRKEGNGHGTFHPSDMERRTRPIRDIPPVRYGMPDGVRPYDGVGLGVAVSVGCCVEKEGGLGSKGRGQLQHSELKEGNPIVSPSENRETGDIK